ncbi:MAG: glycosyltransferase family 39 protein [Acidobacteriota bacterium]|nr:glycosyltransferase family 39 protein [Acidobacteriota bacterium]
MIRHPAEALCCLILLLMAINFLTVISRKSITIDEATHIPAGYYHLVDGKFRFNNEHPPLIKMFAAVPLLFIQPAAPPLPEAGPAKSHREYAANAIWSFWGSNTVRFETISFWSRVPMIVIALALGALIFIYTRQLFGPRAAVFAVALFSLEPAVLAHGRVVQTDVPVALAYLFFFFALHAYASVPTMNRAIGLGLASGLALVTKFSMIVIAPILVSAFALVWIASPRRGQRRTQLASQAIVAALAALLIINAAYYFHSRQLEAAEVEFISVNTPSHFNEVMFSLRAFSKVVPTDFLYGIYKVLVLNRKGHPASLLGMYSEHGWWYYFPVAFALKTTLPFLLLCGAALVWAGWRLFVNREKYFFALIIPLGIYTALSMTTNINVGIRHFLPAFPFLFILGGAFLDYLLRLQRARRMAIAVVALSLCWMCAETVRAYPHYMSYMNQLAWQHPRWHYLSDSNIEWGDDVRALAEYLRARDETKVRARLLGGRGILDQYGVEYVDLLPSSPDVPLPETRYVAIGASFLSGTFVPFEGARNFFAEYRQRTPEAVFGNSIYLYRVRE